MIRPSVTLHPHQLIYPSFSSSRTHWLPQTTKQLFYNVIINDWLIIIYISSITCGEPQLHHRQRCLYHTPMKQPPSQEPIFIDAVWESNPHPALVQYINQIGVGVSSLSCPALKPTPPRAQTAFLKTSSTAAAVIPGASPNHVKLAGTILQGHTVHRIQPPRAASIQQIRQTIEEQLPARGI